MNKMPLIAATVAAMAFSALPVLASPASAPANGQPITLTSGLPTGTIVAQNSDSDNQSQTQSPTENPAPAPQSGDQDQDK